MGPRVGWRRSGVRRSGPHTTPRESYSGKRFAVQIVTFGEVMLRLAPSEFLRLRQVVPGDLAATFGGGELNVAVTIAYQGGQASFLTALPDNPLTDALEQELGRMGVGSHVCRSERGRFGIYFVETGANQRSGTVTYDRDGTAIAVHPPDAYDWDTALADANWFHITGITPAISQLAADASLAAIRAARNRGLTVSCDLNFRKKLWRWDPGRDAVELAQRTLRELVPYVDVLIANEEDADLCLGIRAADSDVDSGQLNIAGYRQVAAEIVNQFPNVRLVAVTLRESLSASHNNWGALLYDAPQDATHLAPLDGASAYQPYEIRNIVDRVGAGDSFAGGLIFALNTPELAEPSEAIRYAVAASCLKHSVKGDFNYSSRSEIESLMRGGGSGRVQR